MNAARIDDVAGCCSLVSSYPCPPSLLIPSLPHLSLLPPAQRTGSPSCNPTQIESPLLSPDAALSSPPSSLQMLQQQQAGSSPLPVSPSLPHMSSASGRQQPGLSSSPSGKRVAAWGERQQRAALPLSLSIVLQTGGRRAGRAEASELGGGSSRCARGDSSAALRPAGSSGGLQRRAARCSQGRHAAECSGREMQLGAARGGVKRLARCSGGWRGIFIFFISLIFFAERLV